jgi:hypothetical protein
VRDRAGGTEVHVIVAKRTGHQYLRTIPNNNSRDNLRNLPLC